MRCVALRCDENEMNSPRFFSCMRTLRHENPLGLPRSSNAAAPNIPRAQRGLPQKRRIPAVRKVVAVSSAKGGVGKSTIAANLALAFARLGHRSGILDTDVFGPSVPTLFNLIDAEEPRLSHDGKLLPLTNYGVKTMSMGYLVPEGNAVVWRGLMLMKALQQLLHEVDWGGLDVLVLDMPPGTGDTQLTISQQVEVDGAIVVSTPQDLALKDAIKGISMFEKVHVPLLGMVQNMSVFICPHCGEGTHIFRGSGENGGMEQRCAAKGIELLGDIPLHVSICDDADRGRPTIVAEQPDSPRAQAFLQLAERVARKVDL